MKEIKCPKCGCDMYPKSDNVWKCCSCVHKLVVKTMTKNEYWKYRDWLLNSLDGRKKLVHLLLTRKEHDGPSCLECGVCCKHCEAYSDVEQKCLIWEEAQRVFHCDSYPLCPQVLKLDGVVDVCRYYWDNHNIVNIKEFEGLIERK